MRDTVEIQNQIEGSNKIFSLIAEVGVYATMQQCQITQISQRGL